MYNSFPACVIIAIFDYEPEWKENEILDDVIQQDKKIEYTQVVIALVLVALMIGPLLRLAAQAYPTSNDYVGIIDYMRFRSEGLSQLQSALGEMSILYGQGQGAFLSGLLAGLIVDTDTAPVFCCLVVGGFFISVFIATKNVIRYIFGYHKLSTILWVYVGAVFLMTQFANPVESFYWFSGTVMYTLPVMSMFFGVGVALKSFRYPKPKIRFWLFIGSAALLFFACGGALVIGAFLCYIALGGVVSAFLRRAACRKKALVLFVVCGCSFLINILAPVFSGVAPLALRDGQWVGNVLGTVPPIVVVTVLSLLLIPVAKIAKHSGYGFRHPFRCVVFSVIAVLLTMVPYALGWHYDMPFAYRETVSWFVIVLVLFNFIYLVGWGVKKHGFAIENGFQTGIVVILAVVSLAASIGIAKDNPLVSYRIAKDYLEGTIQMSRNETEQILNTLQEANDQNLGIENAEYRYEYLPNFVLSENPVEEPNLQVAQYYGKESVYFYGN